MNAAMTIDTREFDKAMAGLISTSSKDAADVITDNMADLFMTASKYAPAANRGDIQSLTQRDWWPKFVQKVINRGVTLKFRRKAEGKAAQAVWLDPVTGTRKKGRRTMSVHRSATKSHADAVRVSKALIRRRLATVNAAKASLGWIATKFAPWKVKAFRHKNMKLSYIYLPIPKSKNPFALAVVNYSNKHRAWVNSSEATSGRPTPEADVAKKASMGERALRMALPTVARRMRDALEKRLAKRCADASATGRSLARAI